MDIATLIGIILCFCAMFGPILMANKLALYIDIPSVVIVGLGAFAATLAAFTLGDTINMIAVVKQTLFSKSVDLGKIVDTMVDLGEKSRREGILALEREMGRVDDLFMKKAMQLAVDGNEAQVIENVMQTEIDNIEERHKVGRAWLMQASNMGPAYGMAATVIGLIQMLDALDDPANLGAGMAMALITTFYGSIVANAICIPLAMKLERRSKLELLTKNMVLFGVLSIQSGDNPRVTREKLETFLAPKFRQGGGK